MCMYVYIYIYIYIYDISSLGVKRPNEYLHFNEDLSQHRCSKYSDRHASLDTGSVTDLFIYSFIYTDHHRHLFVIKTCVTDCRIKKLRAEL